MSTEYEFCCAKCGYRVRVCGGADATRMFVTATYSCRVCRGLYDLVIEHGPLFMTKRDPNEPVCCPKGHAGADLRRWKWRRARKGLCPRCGSPMDRNEGNVRILD
jgi:hypothetical protein